MPKSPHSTVDDDHQLYQTLHTFFFCLSQIYLLLTLARMEDDNYFETFKCLILSLHIEKIVNFYYQKVMHITQQNWYEEKLSSEEVLIRACLTKLDMNLDQCYMTAKNYLNCQPRYYFAIADCFPQKMKSSLKFHTPSSLKSIADFFYNQFTFTPNQLIIHTAIQFKGRALFVSLSDVTNEDALFLINALKKEHIPVDIRITWHKKDISQNNQLEVERWIKIRKLNQAALACITLQQGFRDKNSAIAKLPPDILKIIYQFAYPVKAADENAIKQRQHFVANVTKNKSTLFNYINAPSQPERFHMAPLFQL